MATVAERLAEMREKMKELERLPQDKEITRGRKAGVLSTLEARASGIYNEVFGSTTKIPMIKRILSESREYHTLMCQRDEVYAEYVNFFEANKQELEATFNPLVTCSPDTLETEITRFQNEVIPNNEVISQLRSLESRIQELSSKIESLSAIRAQNRKKNQ